LRICRSCGRENPDDSDFCSCGEYLRWEPTNYMPAVTTPPADGAADSGAAAEPGSAGAGSANGSTAREAAGASAGGSGAAGAGASAGAPPAGRSPLGTPEVDPNITLGPGFGVPHRTPGAAGPGAGEPPPGAAMLSLRLPGEDGASDEEVTVTVAPGQRVTILGKIRNQSDVVDNFDLSVRGLPDGWSTVSPPTAYLVPYGSGGTYDQEIQVHIHPPRTPEAQARAWSVEVVAASRAFGGEATAAPASVTITPYTEVATELRPERASGRLKARYKLTVHNKANARAELDLAAEDTDGECRFRFADPRVALEPGNGIECPFTAFPPKQKWIGRAVDRQFQVTATSVGQDGPPPMKMATFRQKAWLPWWMSIVAPLVVALVAVIILLMPKQTVVPNLKGQKSVFVAQQLLNKLGLKLAPQTVPVADPSKPPGSIADQIPAAGAKAKQGTLVTVKVFTGTGKVKVPPVTGMPPGLAQQTLLNAHLALGTISPQPLNPTAKITSQLPLPNTVVAVGSSVNVFNPLPVAAAGKGKGKGKLVAGATVAGVAAAATAAAAAAKSGAASPAATTAVAAQAGKGPILIPKVSTDANTAATALNNLGLVPKPITQLSTAPQGQVAGTIPAAGAKVSKGANVDLIISSGSPQLAYDNGSSVSIVNPISEKPTAQLPAGVGIQVEPAWNADGSQMVYSQNGQLILFAPNQKGSKPFQLTTPPPGTVDLNPAFAPESKSIVVAYIQRVNGAAHQLCFAVYGKFAPTNTCTNSPTFDLGGQVNWSPDGSTILVFGSRINGSHFGLLAFSSSVPNSGQASNWGQPTLETDASVANQGIFAGAFSPDGKKLALVAGTDANGYDLYIVKPNDFSPTPAQDLHVTACQISWRSDSQELAVMQPNGLCKPTATGKVVGIDLSDPRNSTTLAPLGAHPAWQPVLGG
jgi:beta-lactam-binding protein with PASTA domain